MSNWFHRFFNPHCEHCREERQESKVCPTCETLRSLLEQEKFENKRLLNSILEINRPAIVEKEVEEVKEPLRPKFIPWRVRAAELEKEDREKARLIKEKQKEMKEAGIVPKVDVEDLEKELEIVEQERIHGNSK